MELPKPASQNDCSDLQQAAVGKGVEAVTDKPVCQFCRAMKLNREILALAKSPHRRAYSVAIVGRLFVDGRKGAQSTTVDYRYRGCGYKLNYCPECGKQMKEENT